jgi:hypothetical protein
LLLDAVHVRTQHYGLAGARAIEEGNNAGATNTRRHRHTEGTKAVGSERGGTDLPVGRLRVHVEVTAKGYELGLQHFGGGFEVSGDGLEHEALLRGCERQSEA